MKRLSAVVALLVLVGCSGGGSKPSGAELTAAAKAYFDGVARDTPESLTDASGRSAPESAAAEYALYLSEQAAAGLTTNVVRGQAVPPATVAFTATSAKLCVPNASCVDYTDIKLDGASGLVTDFAADGTPVSRRLRHGTGAAVTVGDVDVTVLHEYVATSHQLFVTVDIQNRSTPSLRVAGPHSTYLPPSGRATTADPASTSASIITKGTATVVVIFGTEEVGGTLSLFGGFSLGANDFSASLPLPA